MLFGLLILFINVNSFTGRLFIWKHIIANIPAVDFLGEGFGSFKPIYSEWQSQYFKDHQKWSKFHFLADMPSFAFNELLHYYVEFGLLAVVTFIVVAIVNVRMTSREIPIISKCLASSNLSILAFSLVSYSLHSTWIISLFLVNHLLLIIFFFKKARYPIYLITFTIVILTYNKFVKYQTDVSSWMYLQTIPITEITVKENTYSELLPKLSKNQYFLNDYCNFLLQNNTPDSAIKIAFENRESMNQYEMQLIFGQAYFRKNQLKKSIECFKEAHYLIPNRFLPLSYLMQVSLVAKDSLAAEQYAKEIIKTPIKIASNTVENIRQQAISLLNVSSH